MSVDSQAYTQLGGAGDLALGLRMILVDKFLYEVCMMIWRDLTFLIAGFLFGVSVAFWDLVNRQWF